MKIAMLIASAMLALGGTSAFAAGCVDGTKSLFEEEIDGNSDRTERVWRTCVNGRYYPKSVTKGTPCKEGATAIFTKKDDNDRQIIEVRVCENGRYYPKTTAKIIKCQEGRRQVFSESDNNDRSHTVVKVCKSGKYVTP